MDDERALPLTDREDRLRYIIQNSWSEIARKEIQDVLKERCDIIHSNLNRDREARGKEIAEIRVDVKELSKTIDNKFSNLNMLIIGTLLSSIGALILALYNIVSKKAGM